LGQKDTSCASLILRQATLYGISPRTRFDLIINQFVLEAYTRRELLIYQRGYSRSFVHIRDAVRGLILGLHAPEEKIRGQIYKDMTFGGDMRDISVSFEKIQRELGFQTKLTADDGVREVLHAIRTGLISNPQDHRYRNAQFIVQ
jgi:hypothetical protein